MVKYQDEIVRNMKQRVRTPHKDIIDGRMILLLLSLLGTSLPNDMTLPKLDTM